MAFGDKLKHYRKKKGWTQNQLAVESGLNRNSIVRYENNETMPRATQVKALAVALDISTDALLRDVDLQKFIEAYEDGEPLYIDGMKLTNIEAKLFIDALREPISIVKKLKKGEADAKEKN